MFPSCLKKKKPIGATLSPRTLLKNCMALNQVELGLEMRRDDVFSQVLRSIRVGDQVDTIRSTMMSSQIKADECASDMVGHSPLHVAARKGRLQLLEMFVGEDGINVDVQNWMGFTPLHYAILNDHMEVVMLLLKHGATVLGETYSIMLIQQRQWVLGFPPVSDKMIWLVTREVARTGTLPIGDHDDGFTTIAGFLPGLLVEQEFLHARPRECGWREAVAMQRHVSYQEASTMDTEYDPTLRWSPPEPPPEPPIVKRKAVWITEQR